MKRSIGSHQIGMRSERRREWGLQGGRIRSLDLFMHYNFEIKNMYFSNTAGWAVEEGRCFALNPFCCTCFVEACFNRCYQRENY